LGVARRYGVDRRIAYGHLSHDLARTANKERGYGAASQQQSHDLAPNPSNLERNL
jgi:hypothetical protein